jgi:Domain of unknown function (DUF1772)
MLTSWLQFLLALAASVSLGVFAGAMALIALALVPHWRTLSPVEFRALFQSLGPFLGHAMIPLAQISAGLCLLSFGAIGLFSKRWLNGSLFSLGALISLLVVYQIQHVPINDALLGTGPLRGEEVGRLLTHWGDWHWARLGFGMLAFVTALRELVRTGYSRG